jgi:hypothetical protein
MIYAAPYKLNGPRAAQLKSSRLSVLPAYKNSITNFLNQQRCVDIFMYICGDMLNIFFSSFLSFFDRFDEVQSMIYA